MPDPDREQKPSQAEIDEDIREEAEEMYEKYWKSDQIREALERRGLLVKILGIDPSIAHCGWGCIDTSNEEPVHVESGVIMTELEDGNARYAQIACEFHHYIIGICAPDLIVVEWPTFEDSPRGRSLARKGYNKLCAVAGGCVAVAAAHGAPYALVTAWQWKGTYPKPLIKARVEELFGERDWAREDAWEALGLALWADKHKGDYDVY